MPPAHVARALFAGSFDPVTLGHVDIVRRCAAIFPEVVVGVAHNQAKRTWFDVAERVALMSEAVAGIDGVVVEPIEGLLVHAARKLGATVLVRGIRGAADLDLELRNGHANRDLADIETVLIPTAPKWSFVSSSLVKEIASHGGDTAPYLPPGAHAAVLAHLEGP